MLKKSTRKIVDGTLVETAFQPLRSEVAEEGDSDADIAAKTRKITAKRTLWLRLGIAAFVIIAIVFTIGMVNHIKYKPEVVEVVVEPSPSPTAELHLDEQMLLAIPVEASMSDVVAPGDVLQFYAGGEAIPSMRYVRVVNVTEESLTVSVTEQQMLDYNNASLGENAATPVLVIHNDIQAAEKAISQQDVWNNPGIVISLNEADIRLELEQTYQLTAAVDLDPEDGVQPQITWESSDEDVATVNDQGVVTAKSSGTASITAKCGEETAGCTVNCVLAATELSFEAEGISVAVGGTEQLTPITAPEGCTEPLKWESSDGETAFVNKAGIVTGVKTGTATITVTGLHASASITVTVLAEATGITLNKTELTLSVGETGVLAAAVTPEDASDKTVTWTSSDEKVAVVDAEGNVTALSPGTATITATCGNASTTCIITVPEIDWATYLTPSMAPAE